MAGFREGAKSTPPALAAPQPRVSSPSSDGIISPSLPERATPSDAQAGPQAAAGGKKGKKGKGKGKGKGKAQDGERERQDSREDSDAALVALSR